MRLILLKILRIYTWILDFSWKELDLEGTGMEPKFELNGNSKELEFFIALRMIYKLGVNFKGRRKWDDFQSGN